MEQIWYNKINQFKNLIINLFRDIKSDFAKEIKNYWYIVYDIIGLVGVSLIVVTYALQLHYGIKYKTLKGLPHIYFYLRYFGFILMLLFAYMRQDYAGSTILLTIIITSIINYIYMKIFL